MATTADLQAAAAAAATANGVPVPLFLWQIGQESSWNPNAVNGNAVGLGQFMPATAQQFGINPLDPTSSLNAAAQYDAQLFQQTGSWQGALTSYGTLAGASDVTMQNFNAALAASNGSTVTTSSFDPEGTGSANYNPASSPAGVNGIGGITGAVSAAASAITPLFQNVAFIVLAIVIIALAVLSNSTVQKAALAAAK